MRNLLLILLTGILSTFGQTAQTSTPISTPSSPGRQIQDAARASVEDRTPERVQVEGPEHVEILSDTGRVDFGPYLRLVVSEVRNGWYKAIPQEDKTLRGNVVIEFAILKNGKVENIKLAGTSGTPELDRAALDGIAAATALPPLPTEFSGPTLNLRCRFFYNPTSADLAGVRSSDKTEPAIFPTTHATLTKPLRRRDLPKYPRQEVKREVEGTVRLRALVDSKGQVTTFSKVEGDERLVTPAIKAVSQWQFHPAQEDGSAVEEEVSIEIEFHAHPKIVRARVIWPGTLAPMELTLAH